MFMFSEQLNGHSPEPPGILAGRHDSEVRRRTLSSGPRAFFRLWGRKVFEPQRRRDTERNKRLMVARIIAYPSYSREMESRNSASRRLCGSKSSAQSPGFFGKTRQGPSCGQMVHPSTKGKMRRPPEIAPRTKYSSFLDPFPRAAASLRNRHAQNLRSLNLQLRPFHREI
jgi:hypothetical protein